MTEPQIRPDRTSMEGEGCFLCRRSMDGELYDNGYSTSGH